MPAHRKMIAAVLLITVMIGFGAISNTAHAKEQLNVSSGIADEVAIPLFQSQHKGIAVTIEPVTPLYSELANRFITRDSTIDLYRLNANLGILQHLRDKDYFLDLSEDRVIQNFSERLAPVFKQQLYKDDRILGVPSFLILDYPFYINRDVAKAIGLKDEDIPTNLLDLLQFVNDWAEHYGETFPEYFPLRADEASSYALMNRNPYIGLVLDMYKDTLLAQGQALVYDTPLFYQLLTAIKNWTFTDEAAYDAWQQSVPDRTHCLFYTCQTFEDEVFSILCKNDSYIDMPLTDDSPLVQGYELECAMINPFTTSPELSLALARCYVEDCQPALLRILCPDVTQPYQTPDYQQVLSELRQWRDEESQAFTSAQERDKASHKATLDMIDGLIQETLDNPYKISESSMAVYRGHIAPALFPKGESIYDSEEIYAETMSFSDRWLSGAISVEEYAEGLDGFLRIAVAENQ